MKLKAKGLFDGGEMYAKSARVLSNNGMFIPGVVNGALALELYFKSLYILDFSKEFKQNDRHSHNFLALFDQLPALTQTQLIREFDNEIAEMDQVNLKADNKIFKQMAGVDVSIAFRANLIQWHDVFVNLRYLHEFTEDIKVKKSAKRHWTFLDQIERAVRRTVFDKEPAWMI